MTLVVNEVKEEGFNHYLWILSQGEESPFVLFLLRGHKPIPDGTWDHQPVTLVGSLSKWEKYSTITY